MKQEVQKAYHWQGQEQKQKDPKPERTLWPYGRAGDSAGTDQREDRLGRDDQTRDRRDTREVDEDTTCGVHNIKLEQNKESPEKAKSSQAGCHYVRRVEK